MKRTTRQIPTLLAAALLAGAAEPSGAQAPSSATPASPAAGELMLVRQGVSLAPIVVATNASPFTRRAADELAQYIGKTTDARPEVLAGAPTPLPARAIWVGFQPVLTTLFPSVDFDFKHPEEILIAATTNHLAILGRDRWDPACASVKQDGFQFGNRDVEGFQWEYGTVNAVYTFLQKHLDVRWLWPGDDGEAVVKRESLAFQPFEYRYHPAIRQRHSLFAPLALFKQGGKPGSPGGDWVRCQRLQLDSLYAPASGHGFGDWFDRFHKEHPDYFALQPDGTRSGFPGGNGAKICDSNPAVWDQWLADVDATLKAYPHRTVFSAAANDGWASGHCICTNCRAWDHPDGELRNFHWKGLTQEYVALSDRQVTFANTLARKLKARYPGKDYQVIILAYGHSRPPPIRAVPDDNVIVAGVANMFSNPEAVDDGSPNRTTHWQQFEGWSRVTRNYIWRPNTGDPALWRTGGPPNIGGMGELFRKVAAHGCLGITIDMVWFYWATQGPQYYLMAQLAWDPGQDPEAVMDDYYRRAYGPAATEVKSYWGLLEQARSNIVQSGRSWEETFSPALFERLYGLLGNAQARLAEGPAAFLERLAFTQAGLDYLSLNTENQALLRTVRQSKGKDADALAKARSNWKRIEDISREHPYALNRNYVMNRAPGNRLSYIQPDAGRNSAKDDNAKPQANDLDL